LFFYWLWQLKKKWSEKEIKKQAREKAWQGAQKNNSDRKKQKKKKIFVV
jgi:hypothetical protein